MQRRTPLAALLFSAAAMLPASAQSTTRVSLMAAHALGAGASVYGQYWSRDPGFPQPDNLGLSDGLEFVIAP
jgi:hypothetical protein